MNKAIQDRPIAATGASGYVGGRLVPRLLEAGYRVRALARAPEKLASRPWANHPRVEIRKADLLTPSSLPEALQGCSAAYYLVHSLNPGVSDFEETDRLAAANLAASAKAAGLERIIYLGGLGEENPDLSPHLQSRREVASILGSTGVPLTVLRAAMIIGSGSASFEILRYLVDRLPVMLTPRWVQTSCQPIAIRNVLDYLVGCLGCPQTLGQTFDIGAPEVLNYRRLMEIYAEEAGLMPRLIIPLPLLTPTLSALWIHLVTPVPSALARPLAEGLRNPVICRDNRIRDLIPLSLFDCRQAIRAALARIRNHQVESSWADAGKLPPVEWAMPQDPAWAGGTAYADCRRAVLSIAPPQAWHAVVRIGGSTGWYYGNGLWKVRGIMDRLMGGVGLQRGRRCPLALYPGDVVDFWRVLRADNPRSLLLAAEMKVPGEAILEFRLAEHPGGHTELKLLARFRPQGLAGIFYWYAVTPLHDLVFNGMMRGLARSVAAELIEGPEKIPDPDRPA